MIIGNFTFDESRDEYTGEITTLTLQRNVILRALDKVMEREPDYRVLMETPGGIVEFGAAWKRRSQHGEFLSVELDDPLMGGKLNAVLSPEKNGEAARLTWNRPKRTKAVA